MLKRSRISSLFAVLVLFHGLPETQGSAQPQSDLPRVLVIATGGTIAGEQGEPGTLAGYEIRKPIAEIVAQVPELQKFAQVDTEQFSNIPSSFITPDQWLLLARRINATFEKRSDIAGIVVQRMAPEGIEIILGIKRDPLFGPVVVCGFGGVLVELLKDVAIGIPPISRQQAQSLLRGLRGWPLLTGFRGKPPADVDALCDAVVAVSTLVVSLGEQLLALDINPLLVHAKGHGVVAVDALIQFCDL